MASLTSRNSWLRALKTFRVAATLLEKSNTGYTLFIAQVRGGARPAYKVVAADIATLETSAGPDHAFSKLKKGLPFYNNAYEVGRNGAIGARVKSLWPSEVHEGTWFWKKLPTRN